MNKKELLEFYKSNHDYYIKLQRWEIYSDISLEDFIDLIALKLSVKLKVKKGDF